MNRFAGRVAAACGVAVGVVVLLGPAAQAAYYDEYAEVGSTPDVPGSADNYTSTQGFAAGSTYMYSVKTNSAHTSSVIYRVNKLTGDSVLMTNGADGSRHNGWLGHANDMTIADIGGEHYLFVVGMDDNGVQLVKLRYTGTTYDRVGSYTVKLGAEETVVQSISKVSASSTRINFFFKNGRQVYNGSLPLDASKGTVNLTEAFRLDIASSTVDGAAVPELSSFLNQGVYYDATNNVLYYPLTKGNRSVVLVYRDVTPSRTSVAYSDNALSFGVTSSEYSTFEIEGVGLSGGKLYFNTNRVKPASGSAPAMAYDGVQVFTHYDAG